MNQALKQIQEQKQLLQKDMQQMMKDIYKSMPEGNTFNGEPNILPDAYLKNLKIGDALNSNEHNPLIYHQSIKNLTT